MQLSIFDYLEADDHPFQVGDMVLIINNHTPNEDPESYYYIKDFNRKRGIVTQVIKKPKLQYLVKVKDDEKYCYHDELIAY